MTTNLPPLPQPPVLKLKTTLSDDDVQTLTYWAHEVAREHKRQMEAYADAVQLSAQRKPLDAIQISNIATANDIHHLDHPARMKFALQFAKAIEAAHGIGIAASPEVPK